MNHNTPESFPLVPARCQCSQPALQTSSQPVNENGLIAHGLIDGTSRTENRPTGLSVALNGRWYTGTHLLYDSIHNCWLCMLKWVENGKNATSIFSVFNRIKTGPYLAEFVKRVHDLDKLSKIWHSRPVVNTVARLLIVGLSAAVAKTGRGEEEVTRAPLNTVAVLSLVFSLAYASPSVNRDASNTTVEFKVVRPCK